MMSPAHENCGVWATRYAAYFALKLVGPDNGDEDRWSRLNVVEIFDGSNQFSRGDEVCLLGARTEENYEIDYNSVERIAVLVIRRAVVVEEVIGQDTKLSELNLPLDSGCISTL